MQLSSIHAKSSKSKMFQHVAAMCTLAFAPADGYAVQAVKLFTGSLFAEQTFTEYLFLCSLHPSVQHFCCTMAASSQNLLWHCCAVGTRPGTKGLPAARLMTGAGQGRQERRPGKGARGRAHSRPVLQGTAGLKVAAWCLRYTAGSVHNTTNTADISNTWRKYGHRNHAWS